MTCVTGHRPHHSWGGLAPDANLSVSDGVSQCEGKQIPRISAAEMRGMTDKKEEVPRTRLAMTVE